MLSHGNSSKELREDIAQRLEKLNKWQEEQKKLLQERQDMQRQMLGMEQRKLYEMLGIVHTNVNTQVAAEEIIECATPKDDEKQNINDDETNDAGVEELDESLTYTTDAQRKTSGYCTDDLQGMEFPELNQQLKPKVKRSFLRRGEGLKQRFKIDPDALRLNNLPRYKYANAHPQFLTILKKRRSAVNRKTSKPKQELNDELPQQLENKLETQNSMDAQEQRFQHLLFSSQNTCNSTPDMKTSHGTNSNSSSTSHLPKVRFVEISATNSTQTKKELEHKISAEPSSSSTTVAPVTWAKVLDTQQIKPIEVQQLRHQSKPTLYATQNESDSNLSLFELLEQKANEGSVDMNSTCIRQFMLNKLNKKNHSEDQHDLPVRPGLQKATLLPKITAESSLGLSETEDEHNLTADTTTEFENTLTPNKTIDSDRPQLQVRFCDEDTTHQNADKSNVSTTDESSSLDMFQEFKKALFAALQSKEEAYNTTVSSNQSETDLNQVLSFKDINPNLSSDLKTKMDLVKKRLTELEKEIASFKENNIHLIRAKQEHELEKAQFAQERLEAMDTLNDAKIQMEIYLHDERMKIEDEKRKFERHMQMVKTAANSKDRKEITRLKQELEELHSQLKLKEQGHVAAQARLRAQIRNIEKDQKQLYDDIERLTKENKRLQNENMKINRENNNKMLQEINRNIAKLAPKLASTTNNNDDAVSRPNEFTVPVVKTTKVKPIKSVQKSKYTRHNTNKNDKVKTSSALVNAGTSSDNDEDGQLKSTFNPIVYKNGSCGDDEEPANFSKQLKISESNSNNKNQPNINKLAEQVIESSKNDVATEFKREIINSDGSKDIWYPNGNLKKISADGMTIRMLYFNKDIKETNINEGTVKYYYAETNTWHTTYLDGLEILEFPNGQTEHRFKNGVVEVHFPNNSIKITNPADEHKLEEWRFVDGTNLIQMRNGDKILMLSNGQKEIHTKLNKRREYPDGTVKIVYPDGSQETRYSNGRVRLKDKDGKLVMDTENST